jgi:hypothetical protein
VNRVRAQLAAAVSRVSSLYLACPESRPDVNGLRWNKLEEAIDMAITTGSEEMALAAIAAWERHARSAMGEEGESR